jgi:hypothetical protein
VLEVNHLVFEDVLTPLGSTLFSPFLRLFRLVENLLQLVTSFRVEKSRLVTPVVAKILPSIGMFLLPSTYGNARRLTPSTTPLCLRVRDFDTHVFVVISIF